MTPAHLQPNEMLAMADMLAAQARLLEASHAVELSRQLAERADMLAVIAEFG